VARRVGQPPHVRVELDIRASAGAGHDGEYQTVMGQETVPAQHACRMEPSEQMWRMVQNVTDHLRDVGASNIVVVPDFRGHDEPGALTIQWEGNVPAKDIATRFAVSVSDDGTPRVPAWLSLRADGDFDLRWQKPF
jgi:hypothetical protein